MNFTTKHIGGLPAKIIEFTASTDNGTITEDVCDINGFIDKDLIEKLRAIADVFEQQNELLKKLQDEK